MLDLRRDGFLGGRLQIWQPARGYRSGADAVMLAAACHAKPGEAVLELGCGAGVALLCLGARVPNLDLVGVEMQPVFVELAHRNLIENNQKGEVVEASIEALPLALRQRSFDHVIANPPYFTEGTIAPDEARGRARHEVTTVAIWIDAALRRLRPGGRVTVIQKADRLGHVLNALGNRAGDIAILPIAARAGRNAGRVIISAKKGAGGPLRICPPFIMHARHRHEGDSEDLTPDATAILRNGQVLQFCDI